MSEETELKLALPRAQAVRLSRHPLLRRLTSGPPRTTRLVGTYFDTPDLTLRRRDFTLRVREEDRRRIQTLKHLGASNGAILRRSEWEHEIKGDRPEPARFRSEEARRLFSSIAHLASLRPVFRTEVKRTAWQLRDRDSGTEIELALDIGEIASDEGRREPICEAELELKSGDPRRLLDIALALNEGIDFIPSAVTKSERGYALCNGALHRPSKAKPVELHPEMSVWQAFTVTAQGCLGHLEANEEPARIGTDPEGLHQLRIAIRRLRAALKIFKPALPEDRQEQFAKEFRWLQRQLGPGRDWDVFLIETVAPLRARYPEDGALGDLAGRSERERGKACARMRRVLASGRYGRLRLSMERWLMGEAGQEPEGDLARPIEWLAERSLKRMHSKLLEAGADIASLDEPGLHWLRIRGKQARYSAEFFRSLHGRSTARRYLKRLAALQDCLGALNDAAVASVLMAQLDRSEPKLDPRARALVEGWFTARIADGRAALDRVWRRLIAVEPYWT